MADDKSKRGGSDRDRIATGQAYEVNYFARKHGLSMEVRRRSSSRPAATETEPTSWRNRRMP
ncbi:DUF3606 domain-containing protein [Mesorhizobium sp. NPDC059054]|uniref:DUF3606 domain-containing protein n=1 Tax=Mesorhizobium sp. NPDC059054 TaxID=3346711 RepID=UPI0036B96C39